jgi:hypothetical protein
MSYSPYAIHQSRGAFDCFTPTRQACWYTAVRSCLLFVLLIVLSSCVKTPAPVSDDILGEWEKQDELLPPITLVLSREGTTIFGRLRLSGRESHGIALVEGERFRLKLAGQQEVSGQLVSQYELRLHLSDKDPPFVLTKKIR